MAERDIDDAIDTAAQRTRTAEQRLLGTPVDSPRIVTEAHVVEHRAEDLNELASDAAEGTVGTEPVEPT